VVLNDFVQTKYGQQRRDVDPVMDSLQRVRATRPAGVHPPLPWVVQSYEQFLDHLTSRTPMPEMDRHRFDREELLRTGGLAPAPRNTQPAPGQARRPRPIRPGVPGPQGFLESDFSSRRFPLDLDPEA
jgi:hypothetical protein